MTTDLIHKNPMSSEPLTSLVQPWFPLPGHGFGWTANIIWSSFEVLEKLGCYFNSASMYNITTSQPPGWAMMYCRGLLLSLFLVCTDVFFLSLIQCPSRFPPLASLQHDSTDLHLSKEAQRDTVAADSSFCTAEVQGTQHLSSQLTTLKPNHRMVGRASSMPLVFYCYVF